MVNWKLITIIAIVTILFVVAFYVIKDINSTADKNAGNNSIAVGEPNPSTPICDDDVYNCGNFTTQSEAQIIFDACFKNNGDIHRLDADGNGKACEGLK